MKMLKAALAVSSLVVSFAVARAEVSAQAWLETYYLNPQPAELPREVSRLSASGYLDKQENIAVAIGFISTVLAKNPEQVDQLMLTLGGLPERHQRLLAAAVWQSGSPAGTRLIARLGRDTESGLRAAQLARNPSIAVIDTPVLSESSLNLQWGAFLASGDERHVVNILQAVGSGRRGLDSAALYSLAQTAAAHPRVLAICRAQLDKQPEAVRAQLSHAINFSAKQPGGT